MLAGWCWLLTGGCFGLPGVLFTSGELVVSAACSNAAFRLVGDVSGASELRWSMMRSRASLIFVWITDSS